MSISYHELKRRYELDGAVATVSHVSEALAVRQLLPQDFSLRDLAETLIPDGAAWVRRLDPRQTNGVALLEAGNGVDVTAFMNIAGQMVYRQILSAYEHESFVLSRMVSTISTRMDGEKIPGVTGLKEQDAPIGPGMPYPNLGFGEDYIETPPTEKRGFIVPITREAIFFDRTHLVLQRASEVGELLALNKEKRLADLVIGETNNYKWNGINHDTYQTTTPWSNIVSSNPLEDWTNVDAVEQAFANMLDPTTGEPVILRGTQVLVMPAQRHAAHRVFNAQTLDYTAAGTTTTVANPLGHYQIAESRVAYRRLLAAGVSAENAGKTWFVGDFKRAFAYMENWPITVTQAAANSEADFTQDIVVRFKASERGAAAVLNPRYVIKSTNE